MVSSIILRKVRQKVVSSYRIPSGLLFRPAMTSTPVTNLTTQFRQTTSFGTSHLLMTRSIVPYRSPVTSMSMVSRFINVKEFHVHISQDDSVLVNVMTNAMRCLCKVINPRWWPFFKFTLHEDYSPHVAVGRRKRMLAIRKEYTNEGMSFEIRIDEAKCHNLKVFVEDNILICKGFRVTGDFETLYLKSVDLPKKTKELSQDLPVHGETLYVKFDLPKKTYQSSDVKAKLKGGVLCVTFSNLTREDFGDMGTVVTIGSRNEDEK